MNDEVHATLPGPLVPPERRGELLVAGQMVMATVRGDRRAMPTGSAKSPIGHGPSGSQTEAGLRSWTVDPLYGATPRPGEASEEGRGGAQMFCQTAAQSTV